VNYNPYAPPQAPATPPPPPGGFGAAQPWTAKEAITVAWERFKVHGGVLVLAHLTYTTATMIFAQVSNVFVWTHAVDVNTPAYFGVLGGGTVVTQVLSAFFNVGLMRMWLDAARGVPPKFETLFSGADRFLPMLGLNFLFGAAVLVGCALLIVPGVLLMLTYQLAPYYVVEGRLGPVAAMQKSWESSAGHRGELFLLSLGGVALVLLGVLMCCTGWLVTVPVYSVATAVAFTRITGMSVAPLQPQGPVQPPYPGPPHDLPPWR
jgi:uncharacterized membrane protein